MKFVPALTFTLLFTSVSAAQAAPSAAEVEKAAMRVASTLDGVLRNCPASFSKIGTDGKRCVGTAGTVEQVRQKLSATLGADLYSVWRSRDEQRTVYNWLKTPAGYVYMRLQPDPDGRAQTLVYLDAPPEGSSAASAGSAAGTGSSTSPNAPTAPSMQVGNVVLSPALTTPPTSATPTSTAPASTTPTNPVTTAPPASGGEKPGVPATGSPATPAPTTTAPHAAPAKPSEPAPGSAPAKPPATGGAAGTPSSTSILRSLAPVPFSRVLQVQAKRMNGADVMAVQNRLIALMRPARAGKGDGWFGPVTSAAVKAFQAANNLPVTGRVDQATWDALFSPSAKSYTPPSP